MIHGFIVTSINTGFFPILVCVAAIAIMIVYSGFYTTLM